MAMWLMGAVIGLLLGALSPVGRVSPEGVTRRISLGTTCGRRRVTLR